MILIQKSTIHKNGVFADATIRKQQVIFRVEGPIIRYTVQPNWRRGPDWLNVGPNRWMIAQRDNPWNSVNHSCTPNAILRYDHRVVALKRIRIGDEITIDYACTESMVGWRMRCRCASRNCRKVIRSVQFLPAVLYEQYHRYLSPFLQNAYVQQKVDVRETQDRRWLVARRRIRKGERLFRVDGPRIRYRRPPHYRLGYQWLGVGKNVWIIPYAFNPWSSIRHSCQPNVGLTDGHDVVALRAIRAGEEVSVDDAITEVDPRWKRTCTCGADACRGVVRSIQFLPREIYETYLPAIPSYQRKVYERSNGSKVRRRRR